MAGEKIESESAQEDKDYDRGTKDEQQQDSPQQQAFQRLAIILRLRAGVLRHLFLEERLAAGAPASDWD
jgi:hypothetical protein